jgi:hypothetical protein
MRSSNPNERECRFLGKPDCISHRFSSLGLNLAYVGLLLEMQDEGPLGFP